MDLALNNLQGLICHKTQQTKPNQLERNYETSMLMFVCVLWHISLCRLFNDKSMFIQINSSFQAIQFRISTQFTTISAIDRTLSDATNPGKSGPGSNGNEGVLHISQIFNAGTSLSDGLMSYPGH